MGGGQGEEKMRNKKVHLDLTGKGIIDACLKGVRGG